MGAAQQIDGFTIGERVHSSAMASIFRVAGAATPLGFPAIIKLPRLAAGEGASPLLGFQTESLVLPVLSSPHVPRFGGAGDIATNPYLVIEWIEGTSLEAIVRKAPLPAGEVARLGAAVADALHSIHRQEAIHHDLKPENVIIRPSGEAVLIDFGMALAQSIPGALDELAEPERLAALAGKLDPESLQLYYQIALQGREDLPLAPDEHGGFLMTLLRMLAFRPERASSELPPPQKGAAANSAPVRKPPSGTSPWPQLVGELAVTGAARELARNAELQRQENGVYDLVVPKAKAYLADRAYVDKLKAALDQHLGAAVRVNVAVGEVAGVSAAALEANEREARRAEALKSVQGDGFVQDLVNIFEAKVVDSSMRERDK